MWECFGPENVVVYPAEATANCTGTKQKMITATLPVTAKNDKQRKCSALKSRLRNDNAIKLWSAGHRLQIMS